MSDELTVRLRELAETAEALPPGSGAEVRAIAGRRRRRRRTTAAVAGGCAAAGLAAVLTLNVASHGTEQRPSTAASSEASASAAPDATVDLSRRVLTFAGRELPITAGTARNPTPTGLTTVTVKRSSVVLNGQTVGFDAEYGLKFVWVMELAPAEASAAGEGDAPGTGGTRGPAEATEATEATEAPEATGASDTGDGTDTDGSVSRAPTQSPALRGLWISAISHNEKAPGNTDVTTGWIGLRSPDAQWLYERLPEGAVVEIRNPGPTPAPTPTSTRGSIGTGSGR
ncbi:L,D-transpeptidase [Streptomyces europaeiscabiei]|uniref:L,D-transpeptidase n=1 Tax=Streptomyces europaeiscabiei TaxID=146819 RepID=UPI0029B89CFB|nr:L,D-transpeptidase [Streptomyces europaeiscabiei]MDX3841470.1 L,D-transpeptidase [Streptomyces europaeiscabiei]